MRRLALLALVLPLLAACGSAGSSGTGSTANEPLASEIVNDVPTWIRVENLPPIAQPGAHLFAVAGCTACHTYAGSGQQELNAPDLTAIGSREPGVQLQIAHLKCPSCVRPGSPMPPFGEIGARRLRQLAFFLVASKGTR